MRLFVAIDIPKEAEDALKAAQVRLKNMEGLRASFPRQFHLTLHFIGEVAGSDEIQEKLRSVRFKQFSVTISGLGTFPSWKRPRVVWVGVLDQPALQTLSDSVKGVLSAKRERFSPHFTLARVKRIEDAQDFRQKAQDISINPVTFNVGSFRLYKSTLLPEGPSYELLEAYDA